jgi:hypothetical protein
MLEVAAAPAAARAVAAVLVSAVAAARLVAGDGVLTPVVRAGVSSGRRDTAPTAAVLAAAAVATVGRTTTTPAAVLTAILRWAMGNQDLGGLVLFFLVEGGLRKQEAGAGVLKGRERVGVLDQGGDQRGAAW